MSETTTSNSHAAHEPPRRHWLLRAGWPRAFWMTGLFFLLGMGIVVGLRALGGYEPHLDWEVVIVVAALTMAPLGFLSGLGAFDYWVSYAIGRPTAPEDHSAHGAYSWKDYFRINTDHKVIGIQYVTTTIIFFLAGGLLALLVRAELARPETDFVDTQTYNELFTVHASLMIFLFIIPAFAGDDLLAHAAPRLGELHDLIARRDRDPVHRRVSVLRDVRPGDAHELLRPDRRWLRARVPAHLLVLLAPSGLHHDPARVRDRLRGDLDLLAQADLRLSADGALADGDPGARLLRVGAPHVRVRDGCVPARADDGHDPADRRPDGNQGVFVAGHAVGGEAALQRAHVVGARVRDELRDRRPVRRHARRGPDRHPRQRHLLHRRAHPLRAARRLAVHDLRGHLLLVPEDDRADVQRAAGEAPLLADARRVQHDVLPDAPDRGPGHAATRSNVRGAVR